MGKADVWMRRIVGKNPILHGGVFYRCGNQTKRMAYALLSAIEYDLFSLVSARLSHSRTDFYPPSRYNK